MIYAMMPHHIVAKMLYRWYFLHIIIKYIGRKLVSCTHIIASSKYLGLSAKMLLPLFAIQEFQALLLLFIYFLISYFEHDGSCTGAAPILGVPANDFSARLEDIQVVLWLAAR